MAAKNRLLTVLSEAEQYALYGLPDFDDAQRLEYLALTETELALTVSRPGSHAQVYCVLQIGFFKAKHTFFRFGWSDVEDDLTFVLSRYFNGESFERRAITKHEHYTQCRQIAKLSDAIRQKVHHCGYGIEAGEVVWHRTQNLAQSAAGIRSGPCEAPVGPGSQGYQAA
jgi:hypothetical protein